MILNGLCVCVCKRHHIHSCVNEENIQFEIEDEQHEQSGRKRMHSEWKQSRKKEGVGEQTTNTRKSKHEENKLMKRNLHDRAIRSTVLHMWHIDTHYTHAQNSSYTHLITYDSIDFFSYAFSFSPSVPSPSLRFKPLSSSNLLNFIFFVLFSFSLALATLLLSYTVVHIVCRFLWNCAKKCQLAMNSKRAQSQFILCSLSCRFVSFRPIRTFICAHSNECVSSEFANEWSFGVSFGPLIL